MNKYVEAETEARLASLRAELAEKNREIDRLRSDNRRLRENAASMGALPRQWRNRAKRLQEFAERTPKLDPRTADRDATRIAQLESCAKDLEDTL